MTALTIPLRTPPADLPDADTDILIFAKGETEAQLGALVGEHEGLPVWVDAQGIHVEEVDAWCALPQRSAS